MTQEPQSPESSAAAGADIVHVLLGLVTAVRYRKNAMIAAMALAAILGGLYYATATRYYGANAEMLITQTGPDSLEASIASEESVRRNTMPTFENMFRSARVVEGALKYLGEEDQIDFAGAPVERRVEAIQGRLGSRTVRNTNILAVSYRSRNPQVAVNVLNAVVQSYLDFMEDVHKGTAGDITKVLMKERAELVEKINRAQTALLDARRACGDLGFRSDGKALHPKVQKAVSISDALIALQRQRVQLEVSLAQVEQALRTGQDIGQQVIVMADIVGKELLLSVLGVAQGDSVDSVLVEQQLKDRADLTTMQQNLGPNHPDVVALTERIRITDAQMDRAEERLNQRIAALGQGKVGPWFMQMARQKLSEIQAEEAALNLDFDAAQKDAVGLTDHIAEIEMLEHDLKRLYDLDDTLVTQIATLKLRQNGLEVRTTLSQEPKVDEKPISPQLSTVLMMVLAAGFLGGLACVHLLDALDDRFRSLEELQQRLGTSVLAMVPRLPAVEATGLEGVLMFSRPTAAENEAFRTLRTALALAHPEARQLVITSPEPGDGKTTVLANLAAAYAQSDKKVLLIDADLRRPGLTRLMNLKGTRGLSEVLRSEDDIAEAAAVHIQASQMPGLDILPSGPRPSNPAELLASPRLSQLLAWAASVYDHVLVDSPPALATSDTAVIGRQVDGVLLAIQPAKNRRAMLTRLVDSFGLLRIPLLGVVVNRAAGEDDQGYYGYRSAYSYGYGYQYGYGQEADAPSESPEARQPRKRKAAGSEIVEDRPRLAVPRRVA